MIYAKGISGVELKEKQLPSYDEMKKRAQGKLQISKDKDTREQNNLER